MRKDFVVSNYFAYSLYQYAIENHQQLICFGDRNKCVGP